MVKRINDIAVKQNLLDRFLENTKLFIAIIKDYLTAKYRKIPYWIICTIVFTVLYVFNPLDVLPDFIPVAGQLDDVAVVMICARLSEREIRRYNKWKETNALRSKQK